jgi:phage terminase Nu1 subunit (DNA packaging protein)
MPNPKGNPENLIKLVTDRDEPLTETVTIRVPASIKQKLKSLDNHAEFCRQAIYKALSELEGSDDDFT